MAKDSAKTETKETQAEYRQRIMDVVCGVTAESVKGIQYICRALKKEQPDFPAARTIRDWLEADEELNAQYTRAKQTQLHLMAEEILDISDDDSEDIIFIEADEGSGKSAKAVKNKEFIERARLRVDSRKWLLSKLLPKTYGDRTILAGDPENPLSGMTDEQLMAKLEHLRKNDPR